MFYVWMSFMVLTKRYIIWVYLQFLYIHYTSLLRDSFIKSWIRIFNSMKIWNREQNVLLTGWKISLPILIDVKVNKVY